jgi:hypothetical protein
MRRAAVAMLSIGLAGFAQDDPRRRLLRTMPLWVSPDHGVAEAGRLAGRQGSRRAYLASRGDKGSTEAEATGQVVAQRQIVRAAKTGAAEPCMELRLRQCSDA